MQGKPEEGINDKDFIEILKKCAKVKAASFGCTVEETSEWHDANRLERLVNRLASYEAALREIAAIANQPDGGDWDEIEQAREIARKALEDNT